MSIYKQDQKYFEELRDYVIAFVQYTKSGGCTCAYTDNLIDKTIDLVMKIKANRDYVASCCNIAIPLYDNQGNRI